MLSFSTFFKEINFFFYIFGYQPHNLAPKNIFSFLPTLVHAFSLSLQFSYIWTHPQEFLSLSDKAGEISDYFWFMSMFLYFIPTFLESFVKVKQFQTIHKCITDIEGSMNLEQAYLEYRKWFWKKFTFQIFFWLFFESIIVVANRDNSRIMASSLMFLYPLGMKYFKELQFVFYCSFCEKLFTTLASMNGTDDLLKVENSFRKIKTLSLQVNRTVEWSLLSEVFMWQIQIMTEIYWIGYGYQNASDSYTIPVVFALIPKVLGFVSLWVCSVKCQSAAGKVLMKLNKISSKRDCKKNIMVSEWHKYDLTLSNICP